MQGSRLQAVREEELPSLIAEPTPEPKPSRAQENLTSLLMLSLRALSQRAIVAMASLVDLMLIATVFALVLMVISSPTPIQLIGIAGYGAFVLISLYLRQRRT